MKKPSKPCALRVTGSQTASAAADSGGVIFISCSATAGAAQLCCIGQESFPTPSAPSTACRSIPDH